MSGIQKLLGRLETERGIPERIEQIGRGVSHHGVVIDDGYHDGNHSSASSSAGIQSCRYIIPLQLARPIRVQYTLVKSPGLRAFEVNSIDNRPTVAGHFLSASSNVSAILTRSGSDLAPNFFMTLCLWTFTVISLIRISAATCLFIRPAQTRRITSFSRVLRAA